METPPAHISFERLVDFEEQRLAPGERDEVAAHAAACAECAGTLVWLRSAVDLMRTDTWEDAPAEAIARTKELFRARPTPSPSLVERLVAVLTFESSPLAPAYGFRSGDTAERELAYNAGPNDLQVHVAPAAEGWAVSGQVLGPCDGGRVDLLGADGGVGADLTELCEFALPPVPDGEYTLVVRLAGREIEVLGLKLG